MAKDEKGEFEKVGERGNVNRLTSRHQSALSPETSFLFTNGTKKTTTTTWKTGEICLILHDYKASIPVIYVWSIRYDFQGEVILYI